METITRFAPIEPAPCREFEVVIPIYTPTPSSIPWDELVRKFQPMIDITLVTLTGKVIPLTISKYETVLRLKKRMYTIENLMLDTQRYIFQGKSLHDDNTLDYYGITTGSKVHLQLRLRGGMYHNTSARMDWVSINHSNKYQQGSHMIHHMRSYGIGLDVLDDLQRMLDRSSTDDEINQLFNLIEKYYVE
jgi:hypothetical protein